MKQNMSVWKHVYFFYRYIYLINIGGYILQSGIYNMQTR